MNKCCGYGKKNKRGKTRLSCDRVETLPKKILIPNLKMFPNQNGSKRTESLKKMLAIYFLTEPKPIET